MAQNVTTWRPTRKQQAVLQAAAEAGLNRNITAVCKEAGVARRTFYHWLEDNRQFAEAWRDVWLGALRRHLPGVVAAQIAKALEGDTSAARLVVDLSGALKHQHEVIFEPKPEPRDRLERARRIAFALQLAIREQQQRSALHSDES